MAFRAAAMRLGAGGAGAAVAGPSTSHCYARGSSRPVGTRSEDGGWVLPQVLDNNQILFSEEEVNSTVNLFLGLDDGAKSGTVVTEVDGTQDDSSEGTAADFSIEEADRTLANPNDMQLNFGRTLQGLLNNLEVQRACVSALQSDPAFSDMMSQLPQTGSLPGRQLELGALLSPAARVAQVEEAATEHSPEDPFKEFLDGLADKARSVGDRIKNTWDSVGQTVGQAIIRFGLAIHTALGRPFKPQPTYPEQAEWSHTGQDPAPGWFQNPDAVGKVVIKVACVIVALMVFKRVVRV